MNMGFDPEVTRYFRKIISSFSYGLLWMLCISTAGFYFRLAMVGGGWHWYNFLFYGLFAGSFVLLLWYFYKVWR